MHRTDEVDSQSAGNSLPETAGWSKRLQSLWMPLKAYARRQLSPRMQRLEASSDIVQEAAARVFRDDQQPDRIDGVATTSFRTRMYRATRDAVHDAVRRWRRKKRNIERDRSFDAPDLTHGLEPARSASGQRRYDAKEFVESILQKLKAEDRQILELRALEQLDFEEIATRLACDPKTARKRFERATRRLRELIAEQQSQQESFDGK